MTMAVIHVAEIYKLSTLSCKAVSCCRLQWQSSCSKFCFDIEGFSFFSIRRQPTTIWWRVKDSVVCNTSDAVDLSPTDWFSANVLSPMLEVAVFGTAELGILTTVQVLSACEMEQFDVFVSEVNKAELSATATQLSSVFVFKCAWSVVTFAGFEMLTETSAEMDFSALSPPLPVHPLPELLPYVSALSSKSLLPTLVPVMTARRRSSIWCCWCRCSVWRRCMCLRNSAQKGIWQVDESTVQARACVMHSAISCWQTVHVIRSVQARAWRSTSVIFLHSGWRGHTAPRLHAEAWATVSIQRWITALAESPDLAIVRVSLSATYFFIACWWPYFS